MRLVTRVLKVRQKAKGAEKEEGEGEKQGAPEKYEDFKMPEGAELDSEVGTGLSGRCEGAEI